ncbi:MAG: TetR/AcrR family transcriptional regulator [Parahaliea sp.]
MKPAAERRGRARRGDGWQAEKSAITRAAILDAAVECLVERGYSRTTTALIAEYAGVSRGAMMHHFPSRIAVIRAVVDHLHEKRLREYRELMEGIDRPDEALTRDAIKKSVQSAWRYVNLPSFVAYQELLAAARTDPELNDVLERTEKDVEVLFLEAVRQVFPHWEGLGVLELANDLVQFCMRGMALSHMASQKQKRAKNMVDLITEQLHALYTQAEARKA